MLSSAKIKEKLLKLLARREYSRFELLQKIKQWQQKEEFSLSEALLVLDELSEQGYQSDERCLQAWIRHYYQKKQGRNKIAQSLKRFGFSSEQIKEALADLSFTDSLEALYQRKFPNPIADSKERAKRIRFLLARGFNYEEINRFLRQQQD